MSRNVYRVPAEFAEFDYDGEWSKVGGHEFTGERGEKPPEGECWQVWQDVSEESPISPVFATEGECAEWVARFHNCSPEAAQAFVEQGWAPSMIAGPLGVFTGVQVAAGEEVHLDFVAPEGSHRRGTRIRHLQTGIEGVIQFRMPAPNAEYYSVLWDRGLPHLVDDPGEREKPMQAGCRDDGFEVLPV